VTFARQRRRGSRIPNGLRSHRWGALRGPSSLAASRSHMGIAHGYRSRVSTTMTSSWMPLARRPGIRAPGRAVVTTLRVCQKIPSRPDGSVVKTNCERFSRGRSRTRSIATPRRRHSVTGISSTISASGGQPWSTRAQKDPTRPRPGVADLQGQATVERKPNEVGQPRVGIRITSDEEVHVDSVRLACDPRPAKHSLPRSRSRFVDQSSELVRQDRRRSRPSGGAIGQARGVDARGEGPVSVHRALGSSPPERQSPGKTATW